MKQRKNVDHEKADDDDDNKERDEVKPIVKRAIRFLRECHLQRSVPPSPKFIGYAY